MPSFTAVSTIRDADGEKFVILDSEYSNQKGNYSAPMTELQFREVFKQRGLSDSEIEERVVEVRRPNS